jgi:hypothetical protein
MSIALKLAVSCIAFVQPPHRGVAVVGAASGAQAEADAARLRDDGVEPYAAEPGRVGVVL